MGSTRDRFRTSGGRSANIATETLKEAKPLTGFL